MPTCTKARNCDGENGDSLPLFQFADCQEGKFIARGELGITKQMVKQT